MTKGEAATSAKMAAAAAALKTQQIALLLLLLPFHKLFQDFLLGSALTNLYLHTTMIAADDGVLTNDMFETLFELYRFDLFDMEDYYADYLLADGEIIHTGTFEQIGYSSALLIQLLGFNFTLVCAWFLYQVALVLLWPIQRFRAGAAKRLAPFWSVCFAFVDG